MNDKSQNRKEGPNPIALTPKTKTYASTYLTAGLQQQKRAWKSTQCCVKGKQKWLECIEPSYPL